MITRDAVIAGRELGRAALLGTVLAASAAVAPAQDAPPPARGRIVLNGAFWPGTGPTFEETRRFEEYAEETTIRAAYETQSTFGPDAALQASLYRGLGLRVGYSFARRDSTATIDVSRPHPLHLDRNRQASAEQSGLDYTEQALHADLAYMGSTGHVVWSIFAGATFFRIEAETLGDPVYVDEYPYHELTIASVPTQTVDSHPIGFNVGGALDYRFGKSGRFGLGAEVLYSSADAELEAASDADSATFTAGGFQVAAGIRIYF